MWRPKNFSESLIPLATLFAVIGFGAFQYPIGHRRILFSAVYGIIVTIIYWVSFIMAVKWSYEDPRFDKEESLVYYVVYVHFIIALLAQFVCLYNAKTFQHFVDSVIIVDKTLSELGAIFDYTKNMKFGIMIIVYWLVMVCFQNAIDALWFVNQFPFSEIIMFASILHCPVHINAIMIFAFGITITLIGERLGAANKLLEDKFKTATCSLMNYNSSMIFVNKVMRMPFNTSTCRTLQIDDDRKIFLQTVKHVYLELTILAKNIDRVYGVIIMLEMAANFVLFTGLLYTLYGLAIKPSINRRMFRCIVLVVWLVIYGSKMLILNNVCNSVTSEGKRTGSLIYCFNNYSTEDSELLDEIRQLSLQLKNNPLHFSPLGFFTLGYKFLKGFVISIVTYVVIMIQLNSEPDF